MSKPHRSIHISRAARSGCIRVLIASLALLACPALAAAEVASTWAPSTTGITNPGGIAVLPAGTLGPGGTPTQATQVWVTDAVRGLCRIDKADGVATLALDGTWCGTQHGGPTTAMQVAFDPISRNFYVAEGSSKAGGVWRLHWNGAGIGVGRKIFSVVDDRVLGIMLVPSATPGSAPDVAFSTKLGPLVRKLLDPSSDLSPSVVALGHASGPGVQDLAYAVGPGPAGSIYMSVGGVLERLDLGTGDPDPATVAVDGVPPGLVQGVAVDPGDGRVYFGSAATGSTVWVLDAGGAASEFATGLAAIRGITIAEGTAWIVDDAGSGALDGGRGRVMTATIFAPGAATARILAGPDPSIATRSARFSYAADPTSTFECLLDDAPFAACPGTGAGEQLIDALPEGPHRFRVHAITDGLVGPAATWTFTVDTVAPDVSITLQPAGQLVAPASLDVRLDASEQFVRFLCAVDGAQPSQCGSPLQLQALAAGTHVVAVQPIEPAGNRGATATATFVVDAPPPPPQVEPAAVRHFVNTCSAGRLLASRLVPTGATPRVAGYFRVDARPYYVTRAHTVLAVRAIRAGAPRAVVSRALVSRIRAANLSCAASRRRSTDRVNRHT